METALVIIFVGLLVFLAHFFVALFERTRVPDVLYLILIGLIIGPVLGIIRPEDFGKVGHVFTIIALVVILFEGGLELSYESLRNSLKGTLFLTLASYFITLVILTPVLRYVTDLSLGASFFISAVLAAPAPSVVIPLVRHLRLQQSTQTILMLESSLGEALGIVVALAILELLQFNQIRVGLVVGKLLSSFVFAFAIGVAGGYVWSLLLRRVRQLQNAIFTTPSFVFILYGISDFLGFSGPVMALTFGITLGNIDVVRIKWLHAKFNIKPVRHNEMEKLFFAEIVFLLKTFFFVYIGLSVQLSDPFSIGIGLVLTALLLLCRLVAVRMTASRQDTNVQDALTMSVMVPKGTAAAVLASLPLQMGIVGGLLIQNLSYGVIILSILVTSAMIFLIENTSFVGANRWMLREFLGAPPARMAEKKEVGKTEEKKPDAGESRYV